MLPLRNANLAVARFRWVVTVSLLVRVAVLFVAAYLVLTYLGGM